MSWQYKPEYSFKVYRIDPLAGEIRAVFACRSLMTLEATSATTQEVGELTAVFGDYDGLFYRTRDQQPRFMDIVQLCLKNRAGRWGIAWTGFIDRFHRVDVVGQRRVVEIKATTPAKKFEVGYQTGGDVLSLAEAAMVGVKGSAILLFAAATRAVNFPGTLKGLPAASGFTYPTGSDGEFFIIDHNADSGAHNWSGIAQGMLDDPQQATWSSVIAGVQADSGLEWYFDELGRCVWRKLGFLLVGTPRLVLPEDTFAHDLGETDEGVVTRVSVRWGRTPQIYLEAQWNAPQSLIDQVGYRQPVIYAPWLTSKLEAEVLAESLGLQLSANILKGQVRVLADPLYTIGSVVEVFTYLSSSETAYYYVEKKTLNLEWGSRWDMTLDLVYGRSSDQQFPYLSGIAYPVVSTKDRQIGTPQGSVIQTIILASDPDNTSRITTPFSILTDTSLATGTAQVDPTVLAPGTIFYLQRADHTILGEYVAAKGTTSGFIVTVPDASGETKGFAVIIAAGAAAADTSTTSGDGVTITGFPSAGGTDATGGKTSPTPSTLWTFPLKGYTLGSVNVTQEFGPTTFYLEYPYLYQGTLYPHFHTGIDLGVPEGTVCLAANVGRVTVVGWNGSADGRNYTGFGYNVAIRTGRYTYHYGHMVDGSSDLVVGQQLFTRGAIVGQVDSTGNSSGSHLHFGIYDHQVESWVNPVAFFADNK